MMAEDLRYPEHEKLCAVQTKSQAIGEFLDHGPYRLCRLVCSRHARTDCSSCESMRWAPVAKTVEQILAEWFDIDLEKLEAEKEMMLEALSRRE